MTESSASTFPVVTDRMGALCIIRMNRPKALNALNIELIQELTEAVKQAIADDSVQTIWLESTTEKAFCAGGDVKALYQALADGDTNAQRETGYWYFLAEYRLDALIEHCPKPIVAWGDGLVMGGGWGLLAGADLRLVTGKTRMAMPELQIGLFPDVGAAHFLQRPDWRIGTVLGMSGLHLSGEDALALGYADASLSGEEAVTLRRKLAEGMPTASWLPPAEPKAIDGIRQQWLKAVDELPEPNLADWMRHIRASGFAPFRQAAEQWQSGSSLTVALTWIHFKRLRQASRTEALSQDLIVGANACAEREFAEGVRALLIDKDKQPNWLYPSVESIPYSLIERFYCSLPFNTDAIEPEFTE